MIDGRGSVSIVSTRRLSKPSLSQLPCRLLCCVHAFIMLHGLDTGSNPSSCLWLTLLVSRPIPCSSLDAGVFKASSFYELLERLWVSIFDTLLRMSNMFKDRRCAPEGRGRDDGQLDWGDIMAGL